MQALLVRFRSHFRTDTARFANPGAWQRTGSNAGERKISRRCSLGSTLHMVKWSPKVTRTGIVAKTWTTSIGALSRAFSAPLEPIGVLVIEETWPDCARCRINAEELILSSPFRMRRRHRQWRTTRWLYFWLSHQVRRALRLVRTAPTGRQFASQSLPLCPKLLPPESQTETLT